MNIMNFLSNFAFVLHDSINIIYWIVMFSVFIIFSINVFLIFYEKISIKTYDEVTSGCLYLLLFSMIMMPFLS